MYAIGLASRLTGVPVETIRIWERRYSLPQPRRSSGGHRKFTEEDIELLRALKVLVDAGARIGNLASEPREELLRAARALSNNGLPADTELGEEFDFRELITEVIDAARVHDTATIGELLDRPLLHRHAREVLLGFYLPVLRVVGDMWHAGELSIASEHFVEKQITGRLHSVLVNRPPSEGPLAVLACAPGERHEAALLAAATLLDLGGFSLTYLGADLPAEQLRSMIDEKRPRLVVISATVVPPGHVLEELAAELAASPQRDTAIVAGGAGARAIETATGGRVQALSSLEELEELAEKIATAS